jgi:hypothetical protein
LHLVLTFDVESAPVLPASADTNGEPGSASVWVSARPLPGRDWIGGFVFFAPGRQCCKFSYQDTAGNVRRPVDTREDFCQVTVRQPSSVHEYQRIGLVAPFPGTGFAVHGQK